MAINLGFKKKTTREIGFAGEDVASDYLVKKGYEILERNYRSSHGEIDIIAFDERNILFIEVKTRAMGENIEKYGRPATAVTKSKQQKIIFTAKAYMRYKENKLIPRFDIIEVYTEKNEKTDSPQRYTIKHLESAFNLTTAGVKRY